MADTLERGATPVETPLSPVTGAERIQSLDVLRGFALLGILAMNIRAFAMPGAAYFFPHVWGDLGGANYWLWYLGDVFANQKFITLFSMLFGAGVALMHERALALDRGWKGLHYRRMGVLLAIGLVHGYLLWGGDILVSYAVVGMLLYPFRNLRPRRLLIAALFFIAIGSGVTAFMGYSAPHWPPEQLKEFVSEWQPSQEKLDEEIGAYRGHWWMEIKQRAPGVMKFQLFILPMFLFWRVLGSMLLGMACFKWGLLSARGSRRTYAALIIAGALAGVTLTAYGIQQQIASEWDPIYAFFLASQFPYWGSLLIALAYLGIVMLVVRAGALYWLTRRLAAVGRMAFSNYLMQSLICTTLFYGRGFGLFAQVERSGQAAIVLAVWIVQLWYSPIWLRHFKFGPAEWLWRSLSYRRRQPMRRRI